MPAHGSPTGCGNPGLTVAVRPGTAEHAGGDARPGCGTTRAGGGWCPRSAVVRRRGPGACQLVEPEPVLVEAAWAELLVVPAEPHAHPDVLCLGVEVLRAFDIDQYRVAVAVEQDMVRAEF